MPIVQLIAQSGHSGSILKYPNDAETISSVWERWGRQIKAEFMYRWITHVIGYAIGIFRWNNTKLNGSRNRKILLHCFTYWSVWHIVKVR